MVIPRGRKYRKRQFSKHQHVTVIHEKKQKRDLEKATLNRNMKISGRILKLWCQNTQQYEMDVLVENRGRTKIFNYYRGWPQFTQIFILPHPLKTAGKKQLHQLLKDNAAKTATTEWESQIFFSPKKRWQSAFFLNYCKLNSVTVRDTYPFRKRTTYCQSWISQRVFNIGCQLWIQSIRACWQSDVDKAVFIMMMNFIHIIVCCFDWRTIWKLLKELRTLVWFQVDRSKPWITLTMQSKYSRAPRNIYAL